MANGSFESGFGGWSVTGNATLQNGPPYTATDGSKLVSFNSVNSTPNGVITQTIATEPGVTYWFYCDVGALSYSGDVQSIKAELTNAADPAGPLIQSVTSSVTGAANGICHWQPLAFTFVAPGNLTKITLRDMSLTTNSTDLLLDHVRVYYNEFDIAVTTLGDENNPALGMGAGDSLREAIAEAARVPGSHAIHFAPALNGGPINLSSGQLQCATPLGIDASALPAGMTVWAGGLSRVFNLASDTTIRNLHIESGNAPGEGGGIYNSGNLLLDSTTVANNSSPSLAGGIYTLGNLSARGCHITANTSGGSSGGLHNWANTLLINSTISGNHAAANGGGLGCQGSFGSSWIILSGCTVSDNQTAASGGGYSGLSGYKISGTLVAENSTFSGNSSHGSGGAMYNYGSIALENCTVSTNTSTDPLAEGGGVAGGYLKVGNSIIAGNSAPTYPNLASDISGLSFEPYGVNLLSGDPKLASLGNHGGPTPTMPLTLDSPALDAAISFPDTPPLDQQGNPRVSGAALDIGAVELPQILVNTLADENNGLNTGGVSLREAIAAQTTTSSELIRFAPALNGGTIVLDGTPISWLGLLGPYPMIDAGNLPDGIVISGNHQSGVFNLIFSSAWMRGLTIANSSGSAIEMFIGHLDLIDCVFRGNSTATNGGALGIYDSFNTSANLVRCTFENNSATGRGGAVFNEGITSINDSTFAGNHADGKGGAISTGIYHSGMVIRNSTFSGNSADGGGAIEAGSLRLIHSTVSGNNAGASGGGGIFSNSTTGVPDLGVTLANSIVSGNTGSGGFQIVGPIDALYGGNLIGGDPKLAPLDDYGGPTRTRPPLPGSPVIDAAVTLPDTFPNDQIYVGHDQRGAVRPSGPLPDIGAVEAFPFSSLAMVDSDHDGVDDRLEPAYLMAVGLDDSARDSDGDGSCDAVEIANMTDPTDANSLLKIISFAKAPGFDPVTNPVFDVTFTSFPGLSYSLECAQNMDFASPAARLHSCGLANGFTGTTRITLAPTRDFVRLRREP